MNPLDTILVQSIKETTIRFDDILSKLTDINEGLKSLNAKLAIPSPIK